MNKALIAINVQNDITRNCKEIVDNINNAIDWTVAHEIPVVYVRHENSSQGTKTFKPNTRDSELACDLEVIPDCIFTEYKRNVLTSEAFFNFMRKHGITDFCLTGADACACARSTCCNLLKDHYRVMVLSDCITSYNKRKLDEMLQYHERKGSTIAMLQELQKEQADKCGFSGRM